MILSHIETHIKFWIGLIKIRIIQMPLERRFKYEKSMDHLSVDYVGLLVQINLELSRRLFQ
ncbi:hypothetical protein, partial [Acinetobacter guillouiae]|uniref:hypothetical protein n=1 Tax=Acinetobacter guillouiae TaxID=106649 RepID=UPI002FD88574